MLKERKNNEENSKRLCRCQSYDIRFYVVFSNLRYVHGSHRSRYAQRQEEENTKVGLQSSDHSLYTYRIRDTYRENYQNTSGYLWVEGFAPKPPSRDVLPLVTPQPTHCGVGSATMGLSVQSIPNSQAPHKTENFIASILKMMSLVVR